jgi:hypothetical protein
MLLVTYKHLTCGATGLGISPTFPNKCLSFSCNLLGTDRLSKIFRLFHGRLASRLLAAPIQQYKYTNNFNIYKYDIKKIKFLLRVRLSNKKQLKKI